MATLIITVLLGLIIAYFATQNTDTVTINFLQYRFSGIPVYIAVVGGLLVGLCLSFVISLVNDIATGLMIRGKDGKIKDYKKENAELMKKNHQLELENTKLLAKTDESVDDKSL